MPYSLLRDRVAEQVLKVIDWRQLQGNRAILTYFIGEDPIDPMEGVDDIFGAIFGDFFGEVFKSPTESAKEGA